MYIGGRLTAGMAGIQKTVICPATEEAVGEIAWASKEDALEALSAAKEGFRFWSALSLAERASWMLKLREKVIENEELLRDAVMHEMGKTWAQTEEDYETVIKALEWYPHAMKVLGDEMIPDTENTHSHRMVTQPAGVVVAYLAWNFPLLNVGFKLGPALAAGCSLIIKPSSSSPLSTYILGEILESIGFPRGVVNILAGPNDEVGKTLSESKITSVITMIGSSGTGRRVIADSATSIKRMSMELGGNAPFIVFDDADVEQAAADLAALKYGNCGQICVSPNRVFLHRTIYDRFMKLFMERAGKVNVGFGRSSGADMGPLISEGARKYVEELVEDARSKGGKISLGGKRPEDHEKGYFFEPTVIENVTPDMDVFRKEIFGPIAAILSFESEEEVMELANDTEYGLSSYIYTGNIRRINQFTGALEFGEVHVNGFKYDIYLPHGGIKESGLGHDCSYLALDDYLVKKRITIKQ